MAEECSQEAVLNFIRERGGRVQNTELMDHFKAVFPQDPKQKATVRELFKHYVDSVAYVKADNNGVKYVCLKKKFREGNEERLKHVEKPEDESISVNVSISNGQVSGRDVVEPASPGGVQCSDYSQTKVPHVSETLRDSKQAQSQCSVCVVVEDCSSDEMGNRGSIKREKRDSKKQESVVEIPVITVNEPSPLPVQQDVLNLPVLERTAAAGNTDKGETLGLTQGRQVTTSEELQKEQEDGRTNSDGEDDAPSPVGSDGTPRSSRRHFIEVMMCRSPEVRHSIILRTPSISRSDGDSVSLGSSNIEEDRNSVTLDPLEHEWMLCASDAEWGSLQRLLGSDPWLLLKKDFVTGFTCLHWAAKQGKPELIALIINFAKKHSIPISVDVRSSTGYTPLHVAAMHNHMEVVKLLVGAYNADVEIRDYSGRKACQYLTDSVSVDIRDIIGAYEIETENRPPAEGKRWRFSKVLQVKPIRRLNSMGDDSLDGGPKEKPLRRKSSLGRMKPKLQKLRWRTSQIVHSTTFHGTEDLEKQQRGSSRPKTHFFG